MIRIQPLIIIRLILGVVLLYSLDIYYESMRFWFGYILMLIVLRGILVVFTYIIRLVPNERFEYFSILIIFFVVVFFFINGKFIIIDNQRLLSVLLWEGLIRGYILYLGGFLLRIMVIVIFLSRVVDGAFRLY